ncbi:STAS domain-containing protein [Saccharothrix isguenensis]
MGHTCTETTFTDITAVHHRDGTAIVEVVGDVDRDNDKSFREMITTQLDRRPAVLVVDLTRTGFFGAAGVQLLVEAILRTRREGVRFAVVANRRTVLHPLRITLVDQAVDIRPTLQDALTTLAADSMPAPRQMAHQ